MQKQNEENELIFGRNAVLAFLEAESEATRGVRGGRVSKIYAVPTQHPDKRIDKIRALAKQRNVPVIECERKKLDQMAGLDQVHQGIAAHLSPVDYWELEDLFKLLERDIAQQAVLGIAREQAMNGFAVALLDGIEDPHNLGAIIRVAECAGIKAVLLPERRSASLTAIVAKTSAGALATLPVVRATNLVRTIERLKEFGFWACGLDAEARETCYDADLARPLAIVIGSEGKGLSRLVRENCDMLIKIPMFGKTESLNASVAAAITFYEYVRQGRKPAQKTG